MAVDDGVVAPVIRNADKVDFGEIAVQRRDLAERAREWQTAACRSCGRHFHHQQSRHVRSRCLYCDHHSAASRDSRGRRIADRVVAVEGLRRVRPMMTLTLSSDHRVVDGARAAAFLQDLAEAIGNPEQYFGEARAGD